MTEAVRCSSYRPLTDEGVQAVHRTVLKILDEIGIEVNEPEALQYFKAGGARIKNDNIACFSPDLVMELIGRAPSEPILYAREEKYDIRMGSDYVNFGTGGTAIRIRDMENDTVRPSTISDIHDAAKLVEALPNIHLFMLSLFPNDLPQESVDINRFYAGLLNTRKHIMGGVYTVEGIRKVIEMSALIAGSLENLRRRPFVSMITCIISPLKMDRHYTRLMLEIIKAGIPLVCPSEPLSGATSPITLAGTMVVQIADSLSGVLLSQIVNPGSPVIFGSVSSTTDLRDMKYLCGSIEMGMLSAAEAQMAQFYRLPFYAVGGMSDSKTTDAQCGYESAMTSILNALAGANFVHDAAGLHDFALTWSHDKCVIDDEIIGMCMRAAKGIEINEQTLAFEVIQSAGPGGTFIDHTHTVKHMRKEHYIPSLCDRDRLELWQQKGSLPVSVKARRRVDEILGMEKEPVLAGDVREELCRRFPEIVRVPVPFRVS
jgi:trimethylamine--corrinoid protein Co-methyltransferase